MAPRTNREEVSVFSRLISDLQERLNPQEPPEDVGEVAPVSPPDRAEVLLHRAESSVGEMAPSPLDTPDHQEAQVLARRYLEAGRRERERQNWGSSGLFAELALEWAARRSERASQGPTDHPQGGDGRQRRILRGASHAWHHQTRDPWSRIRIHPG